MRKWFTHWRYLGYDRNTYFAYQGEMCRCNLQFLRQACFALAPVLLAVTAVFVLRDDMTRTLVSAVMTVILLAFFLAGSWLRAHTEAQNPRVIKGMILALSLLLYGAGIIIGTISAGENAAVVIIWLFLFIQIAFDLPPLQNLLTVLPALACFLLLSVRCKSESMWFYDMVHALASVLVGLYISYRKAKLMLDHVIAQSRLSQTNYALYHSSVTDELTGLNNRRLMFARLTELAEACEKSGRRICCIVMDIDDFKQFNDTYGHPVGDILLRRIGTLLHAFSAAENIEAGRIGGEEFMCVWPDTERAQSADIAERLRRGVEQLDISDEAPEVRHGTTVSIGLYETVPEIAERAYAFADRALYHAKLAGKNRCCICTDAEAGSYVFIVPEGAPNADQ